MIGLGLTELLLIPFVLLLYLIPIAIFAVILYYVIKKAVKNAILEAQNEMNMQKDSSKPFDENKKTDETENSVIGDETETQENREEKEQ